MDITSELVAHLKGTLGTEVRVVEENCGQIENFINGLQDQYPIDWPCVLVSSPETAWTQMKPGTQRGNSTLVVTVGFQCYDDDFADVHATVAAERSRLVHRVAETVAAFVPSDAAADCSALTRTSSRGIALAGGIKVFESVWTFRQTETI
jgi:hypothetical protein